MTASHEGRTYPKPGAIGGGLIRESIALLKEHGIQLPITSHILVAISSGSDSVGLAHLIVKYGRRISPRSQVSLLHVNHGWRGKESNRDEAFVRELAARWEVPVIVHRLTAPGSSKESGSWEDLARTARKEIFQKEAEKRNALVLTAHQADDLAETLLWRLFTGTAATHGGGVAVQHGVEIRPFLKTRKKRIESYLKEEGESFRLDATNFEGRFLRSKMRVQLMPEMERLFPRSIEHLINQAFKAQLDLKSQKDDRVLPHEILFRAAGLRARRPHFEVVLEKMVAKKEWCGEIHLPGGWRLKRERVEKPKTKLEVNAHGQKGQKKKEPPRDRWVLEQTLEETSEHVEDSF